MPKYWYRGTSSGRLKNILRHGLLPGEICEKRKIGRKNFDFCRSGIYFEDTIKSAVLWGMNAAGIPMMIPEPPGEVADVLILRFTDDQIKTECNTVPDPSLGDALMATECTLQPEEFAIISRDQIRNSRFTGGNIIPKWTNVQSYQRRRREKRGI